MNDCCTNTEIFLDLAPLSCEIRAWAESVGISKQQLREAVETVGYADDAVRSLLAWQISG